MNPTDIFITTYERQHFAKECVQYITERTRTPYKLTIIDNGGNEWAENDPRVNRYIPLHRVFGNTGIHFAWNVAASLAEGKYFITTDPDLLVPDLISKVDDLNQQAGFVIAEQPDWLARMIQFMEERPDYGAISMMPHIFIGAVGIDPNDPEDVKERNMCGAVFRIMDTDKVKSVCGWDLRIEAGRNHEERTICSRLHAAGYKTGIASRVRAYHNFGKNWGYPEEFTPEMQKHNPALKEEVLRFDNREAYDPKTWLPK
jgi:glycosyltransferase involved in cell wall biosynthesis